MYTFFFHGSRKLFFIGGVNIYVAYPEVGLVSNSNKNDVFVHIQNKTSLRLKFIHLNIWGKNRYACKYPRSALRKTWQRCFQVPENFIIMPIALLRQYYVFVFVFFLITLKKKKYSEEKKMFILYEMIVLI